MVCGSFCVDDTDIAEKGIMAVRSDSDGDFSSCPQLGLNQTSVDEPGWPHSGAVAGSVSCRNTGKTHVNVEQLLRACQYILHNTGANTYCISQEQIHTAAVWKMLASISGLQDNKVVHLENRLQKTFAFY